MISSSAPNARRHTRPRQRRICIHTAFPKGDAIASGAIGVSVQLNTTASGANVQLMA